MELINKTDGNLTHRLGNERVKLGSLHVEVASKKGDPPPLPRLPHSNRGCCQTYASQSYLSSNLNLLDCAETAPLSKSGGADQFEI
jgi:hypothetical protein